MSQQTKYQWYRTALTLCLGLAAFLFWRIAKPAMLIYHEQLQLFLLDDDYLLARVGEPGGLARYVAEFLVQLNNNLTLGATVMAVLWMMVQRLAWSMVRSVSGGWHAYLLSFLPVLLLWYYVGDVNVMQTYTVALLMGLLSLWACPARTVYRRIYVLVMIPVLYWLAGPVALMLAVYAGVAEYMERRMVIPALCVALAAVLWVVTSVVLSSWLVPHPLDRLFCGIDYYRYIATLPAMQYVIVLACALLPLGAMPFLNMKTDRRARMLLAIEGLGIILGGALLVPRGYDKQVYELLEYDRLVRIQDWNAVVAKATQRQPDLPMSVCATNLALAMRGELGDRVFDFYQHGTEGLLPPFDRNFFSLLLSSEVYWQLGLTNTAQRFMFEAMEAIPNANKSERVIKRLAETNLVNGEYGVAAKYLDMLKKTLFYRQWAERTEKLLGNEKAINNHPVYGRMRRFHLQEDFLYSEEEADKVLGHLLMKDEDNPMAMQYLLAYPLLEKDLNKVMSYATYVAGLNNYHPKAVQQAVAFAYMQKQEQPPREWVSPVIQQQLVGFIQTFQRAGAASTLLQPYRNTFWYYALCQNQ